MSSHNRNPSGRNGHPPAPGADDPVLAAALQKYHRAGKTSNYEIKELLFAETGISISVSSIKRRRAELGLYGCRSKHAKLPEKQKEQIVLNQMDKDRARGQGLGTMKARIAFDEGVHLSRDDVSCVMHLHDPDGFERRDPSAKKIHRVPVAAIGIHERWSGDGHDKLYKIGFPVWAVVDFATGKILGAWVVPSNRLGHIIGYLFLCLVEKYKGVPIEFSTDCGSETTQVFGLVNALREAFHTDIDLKELPAHRYMRSVHNIAIERTWLRLRLEFGDNATQAFQRGIDEGVYDSNDKKQYDLCQWLWSMLLREELARFTAFRNGFKARSDSGKAGPSGCSRDDAFALPQKYGYRNCLLPLNDGQLEIVRELKAAMGGDDVLDFVSREFDATAREAFEALNVSQLTFDNVWHVFVALLHVL